MRQRMSNARLAILMSALAFALPAAGCASGGGNTNTTNAGATGRAATNAANANAAAATNQAATAPAAPAATAKLNLNTASRDEFLAKVPNLGDRMAHEFEEYRPYKSVQQFRREMLKYVPQAKIDEYERYVFVPVDENAADAATLRQLPGLDEREAAELAAARPYASREAFVAKLAEKVSPEELAVGRGYLVNR